MFYLIKFDDGVYNTTNEKNIYKRLENNICNVRTKWGLCRAQIVGQHDTHHSETNTCSEQRDAKILELTTAWIRSCDPAFDNENESITESSNACSEAAPAISDILTGAAFTVYSESVVADKNHIIDQKFDDAVSSKVEENCETRISSSLEQKHTGEYESPSQSTDGGNAGVDCLSNEKLNLKSYRKASSAAIDNMTIKVFFEDIHEGSSKTSHINSKMPNLQNENESITESLNAALKGSPTISDLLTGTESTGGRVADKNLISEKKLDAADSSKVEENCEARICSSVERKYMSEYERLEQSADGVALDDKFESVVLLEDVYVSNMNNNRGPEDIRISSFTENLELSYLCTSNAVSRQSRSDCDILFDEHLTDCEGSRLIIDEGGENLMVADEGTKITMSPHNVSRVPKILSSTVISPGFEKTNFGFNIYMSQTVGRQNFTNFEDAEVSELYSNEDAIIEPKVDEEDTFVDKDYLPDEDEYSSEDDGSEDDEEAVANVSAVNISQKSQQNSSGELSTSFSSSFVRRNKASIPAENLALEDAKDGKGRGKQHFCYYCKKLQTQIARHLQQVHLDKELVKKFINLPPKSREKKDAIGVIRKKGDFLYNTDKDYNTGSVIPMRRPSTKYERNGADFTNCPGCYGTYRTDTLRHHYRRCGAKKDLQPRTLLQEAAKKAARVHQDASWKMRNKILPVLTKNSIVTKVIMYDRLIILYGNLLSTRYLHSHREDMIRSHLRLLSRMLIALRGINKNVTDLASAFHPFMFTSVFEAVNVIGRLDEKTEMYESPSNVTSIGTSMRKCSEILKCEYIAMMDDDKKKEVVDFMTIFETKFGALTNKRVTEAQASIRRQKETERPSVADIETLLLYLKEQRDEAYVSLEKNFFIESWIKLVEVEVTYLMVFNRKRRGEIQRMFMEDFDKSKKLNKTDDMYRELTEREKVCVDKYIRVLIRGKKCRTVAVLIDVDSQKSINMIKLHRASAEVSRENKYVFGLPGSNPERVPEVCALMRKYSVLCGAKVPASLRGTKLRKQLATKCSTMQMSEDQVDHVANFMGHDVRIHKDIYRQPTTIVDICSMSNILEQAHTVGSSKDVENSFVSAANITNTSLENNSSDSISGLSAEKGHKASKRHILVDSSTQDEEDESFTTIKSPERRSALVTPTKKKKKPSQNPDSIRSEKITKSRWTEDEQIVAFKIFGAHIEAEKLPSLKEIDELKKKYKCLKGRETRVIKAWINNQIVRNKRKKQG